MPEHIQKRKDKSPTPEYREGWDRIWGKKERPECDGCKARTWPGECDACLESLKKSEKV